MLNSGYELVAWTEDGEVYLSKKAFQEQEMLLRDEYYSLYYSDDPSPERYERLVYVAWKLEKLLSGQEESRKFS